MVVTRRVPSPRSLRHLLQVASASASVVGKRVLHVKHGRSASSRARQTRVATRACWRAPTLLRANRGATNDVFTADGLGAAPQTHRTIPLEVYLTVTAVS